MKKLILKVLSWLYNKVYYSQFDNKLKMQVEESVEDLDSHESCQTKNVWKVEYSKLPTVKEVEQQFNIAKELYGDKSQ